MGDANLKDPLWRCFNREVTTGRKLLASVRSDIEALVEICGGRAKTTNETRQLAQEINVDTLPKKWRKYPIDDMGANAWLADFERRVEQLRKIQGARSFHDDQIWFGGLFFPEAFLTATRQEKAEKNKWSLEEVTLTVSVGNESLDNDSFVLKDMILEGAVWAHGVLSLTDKLMYELPPVKICWMHSS